MRLYGRLEVIGSSREILTILINSMIHCSPRLSQASRILNQIVSSIQALREIGFKLSDSLFRNAHKALLCSPIILFMLFTIVFSTYRILDSAWSPRVEVRSSSRRLMWLDLLPGVLAVTCSRYPPPQDCSCSSKDGILYPRPHQPVEAGTWTRSCYTALPSWPGGCPGDPGDPETERPGLITRYQAVIGWAGAGAGACWPITREL